MSSGGFPSFVTGEILQPPLIDDHQEVIEYLREVVEREFEVIATVGDGNALVAAAETLAPDVIVSDIAMPGLNGIAATAEILRRNSAVRIVFVTVHNDPELVKKVWPRAPWATY